MSHVVIDASVWVSRLVPQDVFHSAVTDWLAAQREADVGLLSPTLLLPEVAGAISRRTGAPELARQAVETLQSLPGLQLVQMDAALVNEAARLAADAGLRGADSTYVAVASRLGLPFVTLDNDQSKRAFGVVSVQAIPI